jgi:S-methylmethionine-dependent homocysteine/selenocysteine methylase
LFCDVISCCWRARAAGMAQLRVLDGGTGHELKRRGFGEDATFAHSFMAGLLANEKRP